MVAADGGVDLDKRGVETLAYVTAPAFGMAQHAGDERASASSCPVRHPVPSLMTTNCWKKNTWQTWQGSRHNGPPRSEARGGACARVGCSERRVALPDEPARI